MLNALDLVSRFSRIMAVISEFMAIKLPLESKHEIVSLEI